MEPFKEWVFVAPDEEVLAHGETIRPGRVARFRLPHGTYILGINRSDEVAVNGEFWDVTDEDRRGIIELLELFR